MKTVGLEKLSNLIPSILSRCRVIPDEQIEKLLPSNPIVLVPVNKKVSDGAAGRLSSQADTFGNLSLHPNARPAIFYIYILECQPQGKGWYYVGQTESINHRLWQHLIGIGARFTKKRKPCNLVHLEIKKTRKDALTREKELIKMYESGTPIDFTLPIEFNGFFDKISDASFMIDCKNLGEIHRRCDIDIRVVDSSRCSDCSLG